MANEVKMELPQKELYINAVNHLEILNGTLSILSMSRTQVTQGQILNCFRGIIRSTSFDLLHYLLLE